VSIKGALEILVIIGTYPKCPTLQKTFMVIDMTLAYNFIIGRPLLHKINVVISMHYLVLNFLTQRGVAIMKENQGISRHCTFTCLKGKKTLVLE
jgi:hypothetical protein